MGDNKPSPRVSVCRSGRQHSGQGSCQRLAKKDIGARWAAGQTKSAVQQGRASGGWCRGRSAWCGAAHWGVELGSLSSGLEPASGTYTLEAVYSTLLGIFNKCLFTPKPSVEFPQEPMYGGPALHTWLFRSHVQKYRVCLLARCV